MSLPIRGSLDRPWPRRSRHIRRCSSVAQLGYTTRVTEYPGAVANSPSNETLFIANPSFGDRLIAELAGGGYMLVS
jgi:hypothetical protein